jgi:hypothetical protein
VSDERVPPHGHGRDDLCGRPVSGRVQRRDNNREHGDVPFTGYEPHRALAGRVPVALSVAITIAVA